MFSKRSRTILHIVCNIIENYGKKSLASHEHFKLSIQSVIKICIISSLPVCINDEKEMEMLMRIWNTQKFLRKLRYLNFLGHLLRILSNPLSNNTRWSCGTSSPVTWRWSL